MAFSRSQQILVFRVDDARRTVCFLSNQGRQERRYCGLRFLAAKGAAHSTALANNGMHPEVERGSDHGLKFRRILRGCVHTKAPVFTGICYGCLAFEVEVLLTADVGDAFELSWSQLPGRVEITPGDPARTSEKTLRADRIIYRTASWLFLDVDFDKRAGTRRLLASSRGDCGDGLPNVVDAFIREKRFIRNNRAKKMIAGNISAGKHSDDAIGVPGL